jgi:putative hydrolase of the HAD superfamily
LNHIYLSHEIELRKPDLAIFEYVLSDQGLQPDRTLFIDDSIQHIESAKSMGIKTHHLTRQSDLYEIFS